jgi:hypothetical protein
MLTRCIKYSTTSISDAVKGFLTLLPHQSINFFQHRLYYLVVPFLLISLIVSFPVRLPGHNDLISMPWTGLLHPLTKKTDFAAVQLSNCQFDGLDEKQKCQYLG